MITLRVPGLLFGGQWYPPVRVYGGDVPSLTEILLSNSQSIFPGYYTSRFELTLSREGSEAAVAVDLVLIAEDYRDWYLLLVAPSRSANLEYLHATLDTASLNEFGTREASEIKRQIEEVDEAKVRLMIENGAKIFHRHRRSTPWLEFRIREPRCRSHDS